MTTRHRFLPLQWLYPGYHQPIQAVAILLVDLLRPASSTVHAQRTRTLIDVLFKAPKVPNQTQGDFWHRAVAQAPFSSAWAKLESLRQAVWTKLGFDKPSSSSSTARPASYARDEASYPSHHLNVAVRSTTDSFWPSHHYLSPPIPINDLHINNSVE